MPQFRITDWASAASFTYCLWDLGRYGAVIPAEPKPESPIAMVDPTLDLTLLAGTAGAALVTVTDLHIPHAVNQQASLLSKSYS